MTLEEQNKKLLELVKKYDKFAGKLRNEYFSELNNSYYFRKAATMRIINETNKELNALKNEFRSLKND